MLLTSDIVLSLFHYPPDLIATGLQSFGSTPLKHELLKDGSAHLVFENLTSLTALDFANHLLLIRKQQNKR